ncbi:hypothetical protein GETHLI_16140 [Geothrix limicola]|uniref:Response regulatory domain-containing protein n=1 Tax=Geothrix limicola TaxID=2927978 RepID=A0ABQ5QEN9_9BACT|nr:hypothetical protein [Geothrix limicola]GLH73112.1 hypothetical protein GETHLI_16140 [Geothrix limicola]
MGQRLLLVDSDRSFLKEHQVSLEAAFDLEVASSPDGVLARLEGGAYAAVFICVEVADNKGYALCSSIRKNPKLDGVKIALISAKATEEEYRRHQNLNQGKSKADLYLHKPIAPSALVAALTPLVPSRTLDPDNPFGELVDTELGDDWLDGLKNVLESPAANPDSTPVFGVRPTSPVQTTHLDARGEVPPDSRHVKLLEEQVAALHEELRAKDQRLAAADQRIQQAEADAQQVQRQLNSVTLNLDELERSNRESEALKARLAETEAALRALEDSRGREGESAETLKAQLKEALGERTDLIHQVETLNHQVGEKSQRAIELLKERDRLLHENLDLEPFRAKAQELETALASKIHEMEAALAAKQQEMDLALADKALEMEALSNAKEEAIAALGRELEESQIAQGQLNATLEGLVAQHAALEGVHQAALLEVTGYKEKAHVYQMEIAGLEATMRGQGRDLAELGTRLQEVEAALEASQAQVLERDQLLTERQEAIHKHQEEIGMLTIRLGGTCQELDEARILHEGERLELMNGLDQKEAEIARMNQALDQQQEAYVALDREKAAILGQLAEHRERLQNLDGLFQDIQDKARRGSDLTRG